MSPTFLLITQPMNAQSAEGKEHKYKAGNKFNFRNKKQKTGKIVLIKNS